MVYGCHCQMVFVGMPFARLKACISHTLGNNSACVHGAVSSFESIDLVFAPSPCSRPLSLFSPPPLVLAPSPCSHPSLLVLTPSPGSRTSSHPSSAPRFSPSPLPLPSPSQRMRSLSAGFRTCPPSPACTATASSCWEASRSPCRAADAQIFLAAPHLTSLLHAPSYHTLLGTCTSSDGIQGISLATSMHARNATWFCIRIVPASPLASGLCTSPHCCH